MQKYLLECPTVVCHPAATLRQAAAALEEDARAYSKMRMRSEARQARHYALALKAVANGRTFAQAFDLPTG